MAAQRSTADDDGSQSPRRTRLAGVRVAVMVVIGVGAFAAAAVLGAGVASVAFGWIAASVLYLAWVWLHVARMSAQQTASHALRDDPTRAISDLLLILAAVVSLVAIGGVLLASAQTGTGQRAWIAGAAVASVILSWLLVHTVYMLRYAGLYYSDSDASVAFDDDKLPQYSDFAYLAFTIGMTYQVSDTNLTGRSMRSMALRHSMLSFLFGAVILGTVVNLLAGLA